MLHVYTHIDLVLLVFMESHAFLWKLALFVKSTEKQQKASDSTQISHYDLVFHKYRGNANYVYVIFYWYLVELVCVNGTCIHTYWPGFFSWKVALFMKSTWKPLKSKKKKTPADSTHISYYDLVCCRVQREGQLDISYILVVLGGVCGACMFKWYMYTHILTWFCCFSWKVMLFMWKLVLFLWKAHEKHWKLKSIMKSEKHTWKSKKHLKSEKHMKSTWKAYLKSESI